MNLPILLFITKKENQETTDKNWLSIDVSTKGAVKMSLNLTQISHLESMLSKGKTQTNQLFFSIPESQD